MDLNSNSGVFRIPVSDPSSGKSGLLHFSLPRECVACEESPAFYTTSDAFVAASVTDAPAHGPAAASGADREAPPCVQSSDVATCLDLALDSIRSARQGLSTLQTDYDYADFTIHRAQSDFRRLEAPLGTAVSDTPTRNVSSAGEALDFQLWGARNSLHDCASGAVRTSTDAQVVSRSLAAASEHIAVMRESLVQVDGGIGTLLDEAQQALEDATERNELARGSIGPCVFDLRNADNGLLFAEQMVSDIRNDRAGVDVSKSAGDLRAAVIEVNESLGRADEAMAAARGNAGPADESADRAEIALESLRQQLAQA